jgi:DNA-binding GntR family transcriptional regulator
LPEVRGARRPRAEAQSVAAVHDRLRAAILDGELEAGATVAQHVLAARFDAGRTPLREALRMLQREGLVVAEPNYPVRIASLSTDDFEQLYIRRISLEAVAIRITVPMLGPDDFAELEAAMARMDEYQHFGDERGYRAAHHAFHLRLIAGAGEGVSAESIELADHSERYRLTFGGYGMWKDRRAEHRAILDAARKGDPDLAARRLGEHYARTAVLVFLALEPDRDLHRLRVTLQTVAAGAERALRVPKRRTPKS